MSTHGPSPPSFCQTYPGHRRRVSTHVPITTPCCQAYPGHRRRMSTHGPSPPYAAKLTLVIEGVYQLMSHHHPMLPSLPWSSKACVNSCPITTPCCQAYPGHLRRVSTHGPSPPHAAKLTLVIEGMCKLMSHHHPMLPSLPWSSKACVNSCPITTPCCQAYPGHRRRV